MSIDGEMRYRLKGREYNDHNTITVDMIIPCKNCRREPQEDSIKR